jgi:hypothetical protein
MQNMNDLKGQTLFKAVASASTPTLPSTASLDGASTSQPGSSENVADVIDLTVYHYESYVNFCE